MNFPKFIKEWIFLMKKMYHKRCGRLVCLVLALTLLVSALPMAGMTAAAASMKGAFFTSGNPAFAYVITGLRAEDGDNTVKLYQNADMQSYEGYTGAYTIPERAFDANDMRFYTVTEIGGAVGDVVLGALENVPLQSIVLPGTVTTIGSRAFSGCTSLTEMTFPSAVNRLSADAFAGVSLHKLTLDVSATTTLTSDTAYTAANGALITLPRSLTDLTVSSPLTIAGQISVPGSARMTNTGITIQSGAVLTLWGALSGTGVIEVREDSSLVLEASPVSYSGSIRLTGVHSNFINHSSSPVTVMNAMGRAVSVQPGETFTGGQESNDPNRPGSDPEDPDALRPKIVTNYGGVVTVEDKGKVVVISAYDGYHVEDVTINGLPMGSITRYEFEVASEQNSVDVTFAEGRIPAGPSLPVVDPAAFVDIPQGAAYADSVAFLARNGILQGVSQTRFAPEQRADRAMYLSVLKRLEIYGAEFQVECKGPVYAEDIERTAWYADASAWAAGTKIFPLQNGAFFPDRLITREEAALCLARFTHARGYATMVDIGMYHGYRDSGLLEPEARNAMLWAVSRGYLSAPDKMLNPAGQLTRADMAKMFALYLQIN